MRVCPKLLDCFCGMGGVSDGFALEGFDVTGIDIVDAPAKLGYKHKFIQADMLTLDGEDFRGYDVVWGSPPCRDFSWLTFGLGHRWKRPPDPEGKGMELVNAYLHFVEDAKPHFWIMENVDRLTEYYHEKPTFIGKLGGKMKRAFWGNFPPFLLPQTNKRLCHTVQGESTKGKRFRTQHYRPNGVIPKNESWARAKIPLSCSRAFARACKQQLLEADKK